MSFKGVKEFLDGLKATFYAHVRDEVRALAERSQRVTWAEYEALRMNSYERRIVHQNLDDDALLKLYELCEKNSFRKLGDFELARDYSDAIQRELAPMLAARLRALITCPVCRGPREAGVHHSCGERP